MARSFTRQQTTSRSRESICAIRKFLRSLTRPRVSASISDPDPKDILTEEEAELKKHLRRYRSIAFDNRCYLYFGVVLLLASTNHAHAAELEQTLTNLVNSFTSRLLPILALGYLGKNIFSHIQGDPNAKHETIRVVIATACLLGLGGVWNYISQQAR